MNSVVGLAVTAIVAAMLVYTSVGSLLIAASRSTLLSSPLYTVMFAGFGGSLATAVVDNNSLPTFTYANLIFTGAPFYPHSAACVALLAVSLLVLWFGMRLSTFVDMTNLRLAKSIGVHRSVVAALNKE